MLGLAGFGQTETDGSAFTTWDQVDDLFALLDHLHRPADRAHDMARLFLGGL
jgi:hypothetical protein